MEAIRSLECMHECASNILETRDSNLIYFFTVNFSDEAPLAQGVSFSA